MKKALMILLGTVLVLSMVAGTGAYDLTQTDPNGEVVVTYFVGSSYVVKIPDSIEIGNRIYTVGLEKAAVIGNDKWINVYVNSTNSWKLAEFKNADGIEINNPDSSHDVPYTMLVKATYTHPSEAVVTIRNYEFDTDGVGSHAVLLYTAKGGSLSGVGLTELQFSINSAAVQHAGTYKDTLTFTVDMEEIGATESALNTLNTHYMV